MSIQYTSLNSGSNGNCYYVGNDQEAVLIDAGISCRETEKRMARLGLSMCKVKAIFVSHEHSDHIRGVAVLARKHQIPVYITPATLQNCYLRTEAIEAIPFLADEPVQIGDLTITAFSKWHDAADPHSFVVACQEYKIGVFTDIGRACQNLMRHFSECHVAFLEANYCEHLLETGRYPYYLKNRIRGGHGHLSNREALALFAACKPDHMSHLLLSHLSKENNCPNLVRELFLAQAENTQIVVASRYEETPVFTLQMQEAVA
ncbi:MBL fold metallo-hydrolase [Nibribacter koreensis]|uniref:MBL fold metallo-hydrolase n=1 Tax=Nibribacter koreensis TaxID=1084519 RepID=A0ABP8F4X7_9BACT